MVWFLLALEFALVSELLALELVSELALELKLTSELVVLELALESGLELYLVLIKELAVKLELASELVVLWESELVLESELVSRMAMTTQTSHVHADNVW